LNAEVRKALLRTAADCDPLSHRRSQGVLPGVVAFPLRRGPLTTRVSLSSFQFCVSVVIRLKNRARYERICRIPAGRRCERGKIVVGALSYDATPFSSIARQLANRCARTTGHAASIGHARHVRTTATECDRHPISFVTKKIPPTSTCGGTSVSKASSTFAERAGYQAGFVCATTVKNPDHAAFKALSRSSSSSA
jgi:hypothetical protein